MRFGINLPWSDVGTASALMTGRVTRDYVVREYRTPLSVKAVAAGQARYETPQGRYLVTPDVFLLLNDGQQYDMDVPAAWGTTTLCPFFAAGFVEAAVASLCTADEKQLDGVEVRPVEFCERLYPMTGAVAEVLRRPRPIEDFFHDLARPASPPSAWPRAKSSTGACTAPATSSLRATPSRSASPTSPASRPCRRSTSTAPSSAPSASRRCASCSRVASRRRGRCSAAAPA